MKALFSMVKKYKIINYEKICNEVLKEVFFSLEKKILLEQEEVGNTSSIISSKTRRKKTVSPNQLNFPETERFDAPESRSKQIPKEISTQPASPSPPRKGKQHDWSDIERYKNLIKNKLTDVGIENFKISGFREGDKKNELIIVYETPADRYLNFRKVYNFLSGLPETESIGDVFKRKSIIPFSQINFLHKSSKEGVSDSIKTIEVGHKFEHKSAWGLAQENILAYVLDPKQIVKLTKRLGQPLNKSAKEVDDLLASDEWISMRNMAENAKKVIEEKFGTGNIQSAEVVGGKGGKEDVILTLKTPWQSGLGEESWSKIFISSKLALSGKNPFIANIDLGNGVKTTGTFPVVDKNGNKVNLIPNRDGVPWWQTVRSRLAENLLQKPEYKENKEKIVNYISSMKTSSADTKLPDWFAKAYLEEDTNNEDYKSILAKFYAELRDIFNDNLRKLSKEELAQIVRYAYYGKRTKESPPLFKITMSPTDAKLEQVTEMVPTETEDDGSKGRPPIISTQGRLNGQTVIDIQGMNPMIISGLKFRSTVLSSTRSDLNIKTRA